MRLEQVIYIEPVAKARARTMISKGGKRYSYTPSKTAHSENLIRDRVMELGEYFEAGVAIMLEATFYRQRPKSLPKRVVFPVAKPDLSNLLKTLEDAMEKFVYQNDSQIVDIYIRKRFGNPPRIELAISSDDIKEGN